MGDILFLAHRMPFPPDRGDKIRSHHLLKALMDIAPVHVGCFGDTNDDFAHEGVLSDRAESYYLLRRSKSLLRAGAEALASGRPVSLTAFDDVRMQDWVRRTLAEYSVDCIVVFSGQMGQYIPDNFADRVIIDLCDVDSAKFEAYATENSWPRSWVDAREGRLLSREEARLSRRAHATLVVSEEEGTLLRSRIGPTFEANIITLSNGIDADFFDPAQVAPHPELADMPVPHFVFTGQMNYAPNIAAVERFIDRLLPAIRERYGDATFHCVGRAPVPHLVKRDGKAGVRVWGEVPDVRPFLAAADVAVAPLEIARGVQNKVLEAMAMARPVVLSSQAATGIDAVDGRDFAIGGDDGALIARLLELCVDKATARTMGKNARKYVVTNQSWNAMLQPLADICDTATKPAARNAA